MITRIIVYGILLCLMILTTYVRLNRNTVEKRDITNDERGAGPSQTLPQPPFSLNDQPSPPPELPHLPAFTVNDHEQVRLSRENSERSKIAIVKLKEGDYAGAAGIFAELSGKDKGALSAAGLSYFRLGDYEKALSFLERAVEYDGNDFLARKSLAFTYYKAGNLAKSLENAVADDGMGIFMEEGTSPCVISKTLFQA